MRFITYTLFFCSAILAFLPLNAQDAGLTRDELENIFKNMRSQEKKGLIDETILTIESGFFSGEEKTRFERTFRELQKMGMTPEPDLKNLIRSVNAFRQQGGKDNLWIWWEGLEENMNAKERRRTLVKDYLTLTEGIICEGALFNGSIHRWIARGKYSWSRNTDISIKVEDATIVCKTNRDSIFIYDTDVHYFLKTNTLYGVGGYVNWHATDKISARLNNYKIDMSASTYSADSAYLVYEDKYSSPILGELRDNALKYDRGTNPTYPRFWSYANDIIIDTLFKGISYKGGISYEGEKFFGIGRMDKEAMLHISPNDTLNLYLYSNRFSIDTGRIVSGTTRVSFPLGGGDITHPNLSTSYTQSNHTVVLRRSSEQSLNVPFRDEYHQILLDVEEMIWPLDCCYVSMNMASHSGLFKSSMESLNFFHDIIFDEMQGIDETHPLTALYNASKIIGSETFTLAEYTDIAQKPINQLRMQVILLSYKGFVKYDEASDKITLMPRLRDYIEARLGRKDYDNIRLASNPQNSRMNAQLNLKNNNLKIFGVEKFTISNAKDVYVEPSDQIVVMHKNRDMEFNGKLKAGMFDMYGNNLFFSYDKYALDLNMVDSTSMYISNPTTRGRGNRVNSLIRELSGNIVIDKPDNKSGKKNNPGYPILNSTKESFVYFEDIKNHEYKRDSFYFVVSPYTLTNINDGENLKYAFNGRLVSNILPDIRDSLVLMKDMSLGLDYVTPTAGLELYKRGNFKGSVSLDRKGFIAEGEVAMNRSDFKSPSITFMPDSMQSITELFHVEYVAGKRPQVTGNDVSIRYLKADRVLCAGSRQHPFEIYDKRVVHTGELLVYDDLLDARGVIELKGAQLTSSLFNMQETNVISQHADLHLSSFSNNNIQLNTADVKADLDLKFNKGTFVNNRNTNMAEFPSNRYACSFKSFTWYINDNFLNIGIEDVDQLQKIWKIENDSRIPEQGKNMFVSTNRATDSLRFIAPLAKYNLNTGDISCYWVNHIDIANGRFYPHQGEVFINNLGDIKGFNEGELLCERGDKTKRLTNVDLKLKGRNTFSGSGDFDYLNQDKQNLKIHFSKITVDTLNNIYAGANIKPEEQFRLNDGLDYKGEVTMFSKKPNMLFNGFIRLTANDELLKQAWLKVRTYFTPNDIRVPVEVENRDDKGNRIFNGIFLNIDRTIRPYSAYTSSRLFYNDNVLLGGSGELVWLKGEQKYTIKDTAHNPYYHLDYIPEKEVVTGFGVLNTEMPIPGVEQKMVGNITYDLKSEALQIDRSLYQIDFEILSKMQSVIVKDFTQNKAKRIDVDSLLLPKLSVMYGKNQQATLNRQIARNTGNVPDSLGGLLVLDGMQVQWDQKTRSYIAKGEVKVRAVQERPVDETYQIMLELIPRRAGNQIYMYIYRENMWYYFEYTDKTLYTLSSNEEYNDVVKKEKADKKMIYNKKKELLYTITLCPDSKKNRFLQKTK